MNPLSTILVVLSKLMISCKKNHVKYIRELSLTGILAAIAWICANQLHKHNMTEPQKWIRISNVKCTPRGVPVPKWALDADERSMFNLGRHAHKRARPSVAKKMQIFCYQIR